MDRTNRHLSQNSEIPNGNRPEYADKKKKKWSLGGLFKRRRSKSSDTDSSSEFEKKKGFLGRSQRRKGGSHRVVGKFEAKILKEEVQPSNGNGPAEITIIEYDSSPNHVMKTRLGNGLLPPTPVEFAETKSSSGSLDTASRRHLIKARAEARRGQLDEASSSDEYTSSRTSSNSLQRCNGDPCRTSASSLSRKSRAARNERYLRRQFREEDGRCCSNTELGSTPVGSPNNRWVAKVTYQQSSDYLSPPFTSHTQSATCSPLNSPPTNKRTDYSSSLPSKPTGDIFRSLHPNYKASSNMSNGSGIYGCVRTPQSIESLPKLSPPPPPPRNPNNRKIIYPCNGNANRPSSYAFDAHAYPCEIAARINRPIGYQVEPESSLRLKSNSNVELCRSNQLQRIQSDNEIRDSYLAEGVPKKYYADRKPRSRNPIYLIGEKENVVGLENASNPTRQTGFTTVAASKKSAPRCTPLQVHEERPRSSSLPRREEGASRSPLHTETKLPLIKANEIGIPISPSCGPTMNNRVGSLPKSERPLSIVSERSDELLENEAMKTSTTGTVASKSIKMKPKNLEEALDELEEIYNSLKLSDEDLLDRAERRDLQSALRMNPNFSRYSLSDLEGSDKIMNCSKISSAEYLSSGLLSPRLPGGRRSARPDTVADDMAHRKLSKKEKADPRTNSSIVSQSGSFLLISPALSPPPLVKVSPGTFQINKEPDITLDDVVFRNIKQANNTLKISDPQLPFGIPLGPISPAPNSDYLHAVPGEKYRSTFNPSRTPDVVKDDLAYRNLRKDIYGGPVDIIRPQFAVPYADAKKRRAIRSLSANVISLLGGTTAYSERVSSDSEDSDVLVDMNGNSIKPNRCASYNDLPDALQNLNAQKQALIRNCNECLGSQSQIADEAKILRLKLRELEAIPSPSAAFCVEEKISAVPATVPSKETFVKKIALHKPITLNQFTISADAAVNSSNGVSEEAVQQRHDKLTTTQSAPLENCETWSYPNEDVSCQPKNLCEKLRWNSVKIVGTQFQPKHAILGECDGITADIDSAVEKTDIENSSSGVSSTSDTPDSGRKSAVGFHNDGSNDEVTVSGVAGVIAAPVPTSRIAGVTATSVMTACRVASSTAPSLSNACEQFARELDAVGGGAAEAAAACASNPEIGGTCSEKVANGGVSSNLKHRDHCSRIEIRLSTPEPEGVVNRLRRWSFVETKDAAIMTEEVGVIGNDDRCSRMRRMSGDTPQARVSRYKEERRKQLASQFAHLNRNPDSSSSSSPASEVNLRRATFKLHNHRGIQDDDARKSRTSNWCKNSGAGRTHGKEDSTENDNQRKKKTNGTLSSDSTLNHTSRNNRDKSAKRKSYLNRSIEKTPSSNHNHNHLNQHSHIQSQSADEGCGKKRSTCTVAASSTPLPVAGEGAGTEAAAGAGRASALSSSSTPRASSHSKAYPSLSFKRQLPVANSPPVAGAEFSKCNGFAQTAASTAATASLGSSNGVELPRIAASGSSDGGDHRARATRSHRDAGDRSKIPRRITSPPTPPAQTAAIFANGYSAESHDSNCVVTTDAEASSTFFESEHNSSLVDKTRNSTYSNDEPSPSHSNHLLRIVQNCTEEFLPNSVNCTGEITPPNDTNLEDFDCLETSAACHSGSASVKYTPTHHGATSPPNSSLDIIEEDVAPKPSILKNKFGQRSNSLEPSKPNSILKRKNLEDSGIVTSTPKCNGSSGCRQGILKKHSSLDEEEVRRRSCSPDVADLSYRMQEFKPILKPDRRSSMEELVRIRSPELHSILKRSKPNTDEHWDGAGSGSPAGGANPQGILKRKTYRASGGHSQLTANCARHSLELPPTYYRDACCADGGDAAVKPILKNKQHSLDAAVPSEKGALASMDAPPRPILKKKQLSESEQEEEKPMKPILKASRKSSDEEEAAATMNHVSSRESGRAAIRPILKRSEGDHRYSVDTRIVKSDDDCAMGSHERQNRVKRHSLPGVGILNRRSVSPCGFREHSFCMSRDTSNAENFLVDGNGVRNFDTLFSCESQTSTNELQRNAEQFEAQPITRERVSCESSVEENHRKEKPSLKNMDSNDENQPSNDENQPSNDIVELNEEAPKTDDQDVICKLRRSNSVSMKASLFSQLEKDNKKAAEEQMGKKKNESSVTRRKLRVKCTDLSSRFATQPVTVEEVAEAKKQNQTARNKVADTKSEILEDKENNADSAYLSIAERVRLFSAKVESPLGSNVLRSSKRAGSRFCTQPITFEEVQMAEKCSTESSYSNLDSNKKQLADKLIAEIASKHKLHKAVAENSSETGSQSEGDTSSSGGREIRSILLGKPHQPEKHRDVTRSKSMHCGSVVATKGKDVVDDCPVINGTSSIAQRLAALQKSGQVDWRKRISRIAPENELSPIINVKVNEKQELLKKELTNGFRSKISNISQNDEKNDGTLAERLEKLETSRQTWKERVEPSDAVQFSVAGKMATTLTASPLPSPDTSLLGDRRRRGPAPYRFRSFREHKKETHSVPTTPEKSKSTSNVCRSNSLPSEATDDEDDKAKTSKKNDTVVNVPQIFDEEFSTFFGKVDNLPNAENVGELTTDFSDLKIESPRLLPTHKKIRAQRKHATSGNPLKTMATRIEIKNEYREVKSNIAEREVKRMNVEKVSKHSTLAVEALAGLASKEDFQAVQLKKAAPLSSPMLPYKPLMLLHVKGRRHVQTRLVQPVLESINSGDSYILVTPKEVYHWIGRFSNVIERSRGAEIAQHIANTHDLGCAAATQVHTVVEDTLKTNSKVAANFWKHLGVSAEESASIKAFEGGHPDEDEIYENALISTNMIYEATEEELIPVEKFWAAVPKIQILDPNKVLVFDFGSELYVWMGKNVDLKLRKSSVKLAKELWDNGFNYEECDLCPITSASIIGNRQSDDSIKKGKTRPDWCLFAKVTQHMETVLFREKFLDWPDFSRVIRQKGKDEDTEKQLESVNKLEPCDVEEMLASKMVEPDLVLEGSHLGRGDKYFDNELRKYYLIKTLGVRMWHIAEFESEEVPETSSGQFFSTDSYVIRWQYSISYTGRELSGLPSKHTTVGRDRCVYFCWQGKNASLNEQGAAALLTVELDKEKGIQLRICQGYEPPAFFNLFKGRTVIYRNKPSSNDKEWKLFICRGEIESEAVLLEVSCNIKQLRSRAAFVLLNVATGTLFLWQGCKATKTASKVCRNIVNSLHDQPPKELGLHPGVKLHIDEIKEGTEPKEFFSGLGGKSKKLYLSLVNDNEVYDTTPLLFQLSSMSGTFCATPVWAACRTTETVTAYPFLQEDLYSASQPTLFLMDTGKELWLWQGWWPEREKSLECEHSSNSEEDEPVQNPDKDRGSASVRWQAERRAAMQTALDYWKSKYPANAVKAYLVWAGLEPTLFTNLFPEWNDRDDVAEMNILDGRKPGEILDVEQELERLTQSTYPIEQLLQRPLPDGVDPTKLELYLSPSHFKEILKMTKEEFAALPSWKQTNLKKNAGLF